jgi:hypothetical protein
MSGSGGLHWPAKCLETMRPGDIKRRVTGRHIKIGESQVASNPRQSGVLAAKCSISADFSKGPQTRHSTTSILSTSASAIDESRRDAIHKLNLWQAQVPLACGTKLRSYEILSVLGAGGMGEVYARMPACPGSLCRPRSNNFSRPSFCEYSRFRILNQVLCSRSLTYGACLCLATTASLTD